MFFAAAVLIRTNLAFVPAVILAIFPLLTTSRSILDRVRPVLWMGVGGAATLLSVCALYWLTGNGGLFFRSFVVVPLAYVSGGLGYGVMFVALLHEAIPKLQFSILGSAKELLQLAFWVVGCLGFLAMAIVSFLDTGQGFRLQVITAFSSALMLSTLASPYPWGHYLIQAVPVFAISYSFLLSVLGPMTYPMALVTYVIAVFCISPQSSRQYLMELLNMHAFPYHGDTIQLANYIRKVSAPSDTILVSEDILLYWLTDKFPVVPVAAFPINIVFNEQRVLKPLYGQSATTESVLETIFSKSPTWIVLIDGGADAVFLDNPTFRSHLGTQYHLETRVVGRLIFKHN